MGRRDTDRQAGAGHRQVTILFLLSPTESRRGRKIGYVTVPASSVMNLRLFTR
jgi:hypothetical protein